MKNHFYLLLDRLVQSSLMSQTTGTTITTFNFFFLLWRSDCYKNKSSLDFYFIYRLEPQPFQSVFLSSSTPPPCYSVLKFKNKKARPLSLSPLALKEKHYFL